MPASHKTDKSINSVLPFFHWLKNHSIDYQYFPINQIQQYIVHDEFLLYAGTSVKF
jgi:hypothetical protein